MYFHSKKIVECASDDQYRPAMTHVCLRYFPEADKYGIKGAFLEATDGRRLVRVQCTLEDDESLDIIPRDGTCKILIPVSVIKAALGSGGKKKWTSYQISIQKEYFVLSDGSMHKRPDPSLEWPNTDAVFPETSVVNQSVCINPTFVKECAEALGIDSDKPVNFFRRLGARDPYVIKGINGVAIIMPGTLNDETDLGISGSDSASRWFLSMTDEYLKGITLGYTEGMSAPEEVDQPINTRLGSKGTAWFNGYVAGWEQAKKDKEISKND
jgi:hypothetical protein